MCFRNMKYIVITISGYLNTISSSDINTEKDRDSRMGM